MLCNRFDMWVLTLESEFFILLFDNLLSLCLTDTKRDAKKKFSYRERSNKIPLRDRLKQAETDMLFEKSQREAQIRANRRIAEKLRQEEALKAAKKKPNGILKSGDGSNKSGYVTLTQDQLTTILNTLSKVQGSNDEVNLDVGR